MNDQVADAAIQNNFRLYRQRGNESTLSLCRSFRSQIRITNTLSRMKSYAKPYQCRYTCWSNGKATNLFNGVHKAERNAVNACPVEYGKLTISR